MFLTDMRTEGAFMERMIREMLYKMNSDKKKKLIQRLEETHDKDLKEFIIFLKSFVE